MEATTERLNQTVLQDMSDSEKETWKKSLETIRQANFQLTIKELPNRRIRQLYFFIVISFLGSAVFSFSFLKQAVLVLGCSHQRTIQCTSGTK